MSPTIRHKYKYFHSTVQRAKDRRRKFHFGARNVKFNLSFVLRDWDFQAYHVLDHEKLKYRLRRKDPL